MDANMETEPLVESDRRPMQRARLWRSLGIIVIVSAAVLLVFGAGVACGSVLRRREGASGGSAVYDIEAIGNKEKLIYIIRHGEKIEGDAARGQLAYEAQCLSEVGWARAYHLMSIFGPRPRPPFKTPQALFSANYADPVVCRDVHGWYRTQQTISALASDTPGGLNLPIDNTTGFMPAICGLTWNITAKPEYIKHKSDSQPEPYKSSVINWTEAQPVGGTCSPKGFGGGDAMCCNPAAAKKMIEKLMEPGISTILVAWEHSNIAFLARALGAPEDKVVHCKDANGETVDCWPGSNFDMVYALTFNDKGEFQNIDTGFRQGFTAENFLGPHNYCGAVADTKYPITYPVSEPRLSPLPTGYVIDN